MKELAIVIPAYKKEYLGATIESIASQSCKDFNLYIGDDNSPYNLYDIIKRYEKCISIKYKKFQNNLGGKNLAEHWNRCLSLVNDEKYIWFFSDDDIMDCTCVENFLKTIRSQPKVFNVYHFNICMINKSGEVIRKPAAFPDSLDAVDFFRLLYLEKIEARMPEFIFSAQSLRKNGGFVPFDLAWRTDNATVIKNSLDTGIYTVAGSNVLWRISDVNISAKNTDLLLRKDEATICFFNWVYDILSNKFGRFPIPPLTMIKMIKIKMGVLCGTFNIFTLWDVSKRFNYIDNYRKRVLFVCVSIFIRLNKTINYLWKSLCSFVKM